MKNNSAVLRAFSLIGPEEILKLSQVLHVATGLKKVVGESYTLWDEGPARPAPSRPLGKVLQFPINKSSVPESEAVPEPHLKPPADGKVFDAPFITGEAAVLYRQISREAEEHLQKCAAKTGYQKAGAVLMVKTPIEGGREKVHFASTNGVLVDKKSA